MEVYFLDREAMITHFTPFMQCEALAECAKLLRMKDAKWLLHFSFVLGHILLKIKIDQ
jgi:hypothetical protein